MTEFTEDFGPETEEADDRGTDILVRTRHQHFVEIDNKDGKAQNPKTGKLNPEKIIINRFPSRTLGDWLHRPLSGYQVKNSGNIKHFIMRYVDDIFYLLSMSPSFQSLVYQFPSMTETLVGFAPLKKAGGSYSRLHNVFVLDYKPTPLADLMRSDSQYHRHVSNGAHEYRHVWQMAGMKPTKRTGILDELSESLFREADAVAFQATVTWELKILGVSGPWDHFCGAYPVCADAFKKCLEKDPESFSTGKAQNVAFRAWFRDKSTVSFYVDKFADDINKRFEDLKRDYDRNFVSSSRALVAEKSIKELFGIVSLDKDITQENRKFGPMGLFLEDPEYMAILNRNEYLSRLGKGWKEVGYYVHLAAPKVQRKLDDVLTKIKTYNEAREAPSP